MLDEPYDPYCQRYARNMPEYDFFWAETSEQYNMVRENERGDKRVEYVLKEEGTLNPTNNHFACDKCYIKLGMPSSPRGWVAE